MPTSDSWTEVKFRPNQDTRTFSLQYFDPLDFAVKIVTCVGQEQYLNTKKELEAQGYEVEDL